MTGGPRREWRQIAAAAVAILLLNISLTFENVWPTMAIRWRGTISIELAGTIVLIAAFEWARRPPSRRALAWSSAAWMALVAARYVEVTAAALYGRDINLYWDLQFIPDVAAMVTRVAPVWLIVLSLTVFLVIVVVIHRIVLWSFATLHEALRLRSGRAILVAAATVVFAFFVRERLGPTPDYPRFPRPVLQTYANQLRLFGEARSGSRPLPASPSFDSTFVNVRNADVFLVFIESYGRVAYRPDIAAGLAAARQRLASAITESGREVVSAFVTSPTFGGSSWLAHISLLSGIEVRDANTNARLMSERRDTLVKAFGRQGFRTIGLMPGLRHQWPEGAYYGFDEILGADRLEYHGPEFGWFAIPDQYPLAKLDALRPRGSQPRFVFFPTLSTHFPFSPTPPYQPDWTRMFAARPYDGPAIVDAYSRQPNWTNFAPGYMEAMTYDFAVVGGYLQRHAADDLVMILIGDHQPPAAVSGEGASWDVPVHVISNRRAILDRLGGSGFRHGLQPSESSLGPMHQLLPVLIEAFRRAE